MLHYPSLSSRMRFLCLHGLGTNPQILEAQIGLLRAQLPGTHEFVYLAGEVECDAAHGMSLLFQCPLFKTQLISSRSLEHLSRTIPLLLRPADRRPGRRCSRPCLVLHRGRGSLRRRHWLFSRRCAGFIRDATQSQGSISGALISNSDFHLRESPIRSGCDAGRRSKVTERASKVPRRSCHEWRTRDFPVERWRSEYHPGIPFTGL